jgi:AraC family cel operon transcriptional repressor
VATAELAQLVEPIAAWQRRCGRTAEHLARSCRRHYGVTPSALLSSARIEYAKRLLLSTPDKVITIALDCGFGTLAHFHRLFLAQTGMTPREWRGRHSIVVPR